MMKTKASILSFMALLFIAASCGNADMEKRIANLETRVNQLETQGVARAPQKPTATAVSQAQPVNQEGGNAEFKFDQTLYNFGTIKQGEVVNHTFKFTNSGDEPLLISSATASCGCTVPQYPRTAIAPGKSGEIKVRFDSKGKSGQQSPVVTIVANTKKSKQTRLNLRGLVQTK